MKRLSCLICSVNITFVKTKGNMFLICDTSIILITLKYFSVPARSIVVKAQS